MNLRPLIKRRTAAAKDVSIYIAIYGNKDVELISIGHRIPIAAWSEAKSFPKDTASPAAKAITKVTSELQKIITRAPDEHEVVSPALVKEIYLSQRIELEQQQSAKDKKIKAESVTVVKAATNWTKNAIYALRPSTQTVVRSSIKKFTDYLKATHRGSLEIKHLNHDVISAYDRYLLETKKCTDNTHGKLMKHLRWFLNSIKVDSSSIKIRSAKKTKISLTVAELERLVAVDVSYSMEMQKAKDAFLIGCYSGLRISDVKRLNKINTKDGFIALRLLKTSIDVKIPIVRALDEILSKYDYKCPRIPVQKINEQIKLVCKKANIDEMVAVETTRGGQVITKNTPKYKMITTHVSSKSFITLAPQLWGLTPAEIAHIIGKDLRTLLAHYFNDQGDIGRQKMISSDKAIMKVV